MKTNKSIGLVSVEKYWISNRYFDTDTLAHLYFIVWELITVVKISNFLYLINQFGWNFAWIIPNHMEIYCRCQRFKFPLHSPLQGGGRVFHGTIFLINVR